MIKIRTLIRIFIQKVTILEEILMFLTTLSKKITIQSNFKISNGICLTKNKYKNQTLLSPIKGKMITVSRSKTNLIKFIILMILIKKIL